MQLRGIMTVLLALSLSLAPIAAQSADPKIGKQLTSLNFPYSVSASGTYALPLTMNSGRRQTVYIVSKTYKCGGTELREIWSPAGKFKGKPDAKTMLALLDANRTELVGGWAIEADDKGNYTAYFSIKAPPAIKDQELADYVVSVQIAADTMEQKLFGKDDN